MRWQRNYLQCAPGGTHLLGDRQPCECAPRPASTEERRKPVSILIVPSFSASEALKARWSRVPKPSLPGLDASFGPTFKQQHVDFARARRASLASPGATTVDAAHSHRALVGRHTRHGAELVRFRRAREFAHGGRRGVRFRELWGTWGDGGRRCCCRLGLGRS